MPRMTLMIEEDAMKLAKAYAARRRLTLGQVMTSVVDQLSEDVP
jgi:hypothetical protein